MNRYQIRDEVRRIIRDPDYPKEPIDKAINSVISTLNQLGRYRFNESYQEITLVNGDKDYALADFLSETAVVFAPGTTDEDVLTKIDSLGAAYERGWFVDTGDAPEYYLISSGDIWFEPIPNSTAAGKKVRVYGYFRIATLVDDLTECALDSAYCRSVLAWGGAAEINPTLTIDNDPRGKSINDIYLTNLQSMLATERFDAKVDYRVMKDHRWRGMYDMGKVTRVRG